ncbi:two-component system response regulator DesR [Peribacillus deserti]|uniref:Two-component system response regulator DesR n=1 Tax=Peribacillus deserti TaxID=673318 RepID=A0ABS2QIG5_9BACI|nr:response regulator transcription factor [Peribacillus deserti]MBM7692755.1 two-component system response regulator DesR [Peribacillus deserti]
MIRIVLAEDQEMLLGAIGSLLNLEDDMEVVGQAGNGEEALTLIHRLQPDICIMDIEMPEKSGLEAAETLKPFGCKIIILTTFARRGYFQRALEAGVRGYLLKDSPSEELVCSIRGIMAGERIYSPELMDEAAESERDIHQELKTDDSDSKEQSNSIGTVRHYFSTIIEKIKMPAG